MLAGWGAAATGSLSGISLVSAVALGLVSSQFSGSVGDGGILRSVSV